VPDRVIVVGGGLVGLCTAWFLRAAGAWVTVLEAERPGSGASRGNAGAICPSLVDPLPAPGTIRRAFLSMPRSDAALHVRPTYAPRMAGFLRRFAAAATRERYEAGYAALAGLAAGAGGAWDVLAAGGVRGDARREGYPSDRTLNDRWPTSVARRRSGSAASRASSWTTTGSCSGNRSSEPEPGPDS
jgi:D-amino-acid dehydrogenase